MVDSTNPRVMADNIKSLNEKIKAADVNANPTGEATGTLTKLEVDGVIYGIASGTTVTANPEGSATVDLEKLEINNTVYGIPVYTPVNYSTTEADTGIKWIDGSTIYRKTIAIGDITAGNDKEVAHGITNIDVLVSLSGGAYSTTDSRYIPLPYVDNTDTYQRYLALDATNVIVGKGTNSPAITKAYVTICYTKVVTP